MSANPSTPSTGEEAVRAIDCDVLVVGSGAGGLSAAVTAAHHGKKVVVVEKDRVFGGATAWSGGWMWTPRHPLTRAEGFVEDIDQPRTYLKNVLGEHFDFDRVTAFLEAAPHMVGFFHEHTSLQFVNGGKIADIQAHQPGAVSGGRQVGRNPSTAGACASPCAASCARRCTRLHSSAWASWPARTYKASYTRTPRSKASSTQHGALPSTSDRKSVV